VVPNTRAKVSSSVLLGWAESPGCVCTQSGRKSSINLAIDMIRHRFVVKGHGDHSASLANQLHVGYAQKIRTSGDAESAHFGIAVVTQKDQLGPGRGREGQAWATVMPPR
jgi:hypothetical protein